MKLRDSLQRHSALVVALLALLLAWPAAAARVATASGEVEAGQGEPPVWRPLQAGDGLEPGEQVRTGDDGRAEIVLARATVRLYPNSLLRVPEADVVDGVELERGRSLFDVLRGDRPFEVRTPEVVVSVKGTRFSVSLAGAAASVAVFHGTVGVRSLALDLAREVLVREGFVASGHEEFELSVHDLADPWSGFSHDVLPALPLPDLDATGGSSASLEAARAAARAEALPEAVTRAAERHPDVRERVVALQQERLGEAGDGLPAAGARPADPARDRSDRRGPRRDRIADAPAALAAAIEESFVETWMNGGDPTGGGGSGGGGTFDVTFVSGSGMPGPDHVLIEAQTGQSWQLDEGFIEDVLDGSLPLPPPLLTLLATQGINDPFLFAQQLLVLFDDH